MEVHPDAVAICREDKRRTVWHGEGGGEGRKGFRLMRMVHGWSRQWQSRELAMSRKRGGAVDGIHTQLPEVLEVNGIRLEL